jgi:hypothetical protein
VRIWVHCYGHINNTGPDRFTDQPSNYLDADHIADHIANHVIANRLSNYLVADLFTNHDRLADEFVTDDSTNHVANHRVTNRLANHIISNRSPDREGAATSKFNHTFAHSGASDSRAASQSNHSIAH